MIVDQRFDRLGRQIAWNHQGSEPAVVFCHGTPWSSRLWAPFANAFAADFTVYLWDMPGYGRRRMLTGCALLAAEERGSAQRGMSVLSRGS